jgi:hypothetical protein
MTTFNAGGYSLGKLRHAAISLILGVCVLATAGCSATVLSPEATADAFVSALQDGDRETVAETSDLDVSVGVSTLLGPDAKTGFQTESQDGDRAIVALPGSKSNLKMTLEKGDDGWQVVEITYQVESQRQEEYMAPSITEETDMLISGAQFDFDGEAGQRTVNVVDTYVHGAVSESKVETLSVDVESVPPLTLVGTGVRSNLLDDNPAYTPRLTAMGPNWKMTETVRVDESIMVRLQSGWRADVEVEHYIVLPTGERVRDVLSTGLVADSRWEWTPNIGGLSETEWLKDYPNTWRPGQYLFVVKINGMAGWWDSMRVVE